jgi:hypothetical protein
MMPHSKRKITSMMDMNGYLLICVVSLGFYSSSMIIHMNQLFVSFIISPLTITHYIYTHLHPPTHWRDPPQSILSHCWLWNQIISLIQRFCFIGVWNPLLDGGYGGNVPSTYLTKGVMPGETRNFGVPPWWGI